ncbi:MAG TPA: LysR substrate-binding domain-containing protein, partial [Polyangiaceae bacterium LLY-WYZ-15_(1-7)]|nr:LysR substrate-binding domain-containing protein [Polyangiaceae bacterium LLY-WYZ-15_(1-7)]
ERASAERQRLRVGVLATLSRNFQVGFLGPAFGREDVDLVVRSGGLEELIRRLEAHQLDVVLATQAPARDDESAWVPHRIDEQPVSLIAHPELRRRRRRLRTLLSDEPLVVPTVESSIRTGFDALVEQLGAKPRIVAEIDDMAMLRLAARAHEGLSVIPPIVVKDELDEGSLVELARLPDLVETFFAITVPRRRPNPLLQELVAGARARSRRVGSAPL